MKVNTTCSSCKLLAVVSRNLRSLPTYVGYTLAVGVLIVIGYYLNKSPLSSQVGDINGDGVQELAINVWRRGNFGSSKPFWVKENDMSYKNHLYVYEKKMGVYKPLWVSSNLEEPNCWFGFYDVDKDKKDELIVGEGSYLDQPVCKVHKIGIWDWSGWGFFKQTEIKL